MLDQPPAFGRSRRSTVSKPLGATVGMSLAAHRYWRTVTTMRRVRLTFCQCGRLGLVMLLALCQACTATLAGFSEDDMHVSSCSTSVKGYGCAATCTDDRVAVCRKVPPNYQPSCACE